MFHVEHTPIEESPTLLGRAGNELVRAGLEAGDRGPAQQLGQRDRRPADSRLEGPVAAGKPDADAGPDGRLNISVDAETRRATPDQRVLRPAAERARMRQQVRRFKQRRLAGAVRADEDIPAGIEGELEARKRAKVLEPEFAQPHAKTRPRARPRGAAA